MKSTLLLLAASLGFFIAPAAFANDFPARISFVMKEKMSCRGAKKILRTDGLFVYCNSREGLSREFSAEYFGRRPVSDVVSEVGTHSKIQVATPDGVEIDAPAQTN